MSPQAMGELVDELVEMEYVVRRPDPTDGRAKLIVLNEEGQSASRRGAPRSPPSRRAPASFSVSEFIGSCVVCRSGSWTSADLIAAGALPLQPACT
jgi:DNA-binding MarR family transcriptional regulator